jgi:hypothetical protein
MLHALEGYNLKCEGLNEVVFLLAEDDIHVDATRLPRTTSWNTMLLYLSCA